MFDSPKPLSQVGILIVLKMANTFHEYLVHLLFVVIIEGLCAKRAYIGFWADFHFLQDWAYFWQTDLFWHEKHRSVIFLVCLRFVLQK